MAIYHFSVKAISRGNGSSAVAAAAYRSASRLEDERLGRAHDFSKKADVIHSEVMLAEGAPERWLDRPKLWNEVEAGEKRKDARLAREVEFSIPREMDRAEGVRLAREFVQRQFVDRGMVADLNVHWDEPKGEEPKPHAHVMLSTREVVRGADGEGRFGKKVVAWNDRMLVVEWREAWAAHVNGRLAELGHGARIDHRSYREQGIALEPQGKIGPAGARREARGEDAERASEHRDIARRNGETIVADPRVALDAITRGQSTFTDHDLARFVHRHSDDPAQYAQVLSAVKASPEVVALGRDGRGRERFSTVEMLEVERRLERSGEALAERQDHEVDRRERAAADAAARGRGLVLSEEQSDAVRHVTGAGGLSLVLGYAGTGKSAMLGVARDAWERSGLTVRGAALSGIAAENLEAGAAIPSRTLASMEHGWGQGRDLLTSRDVLVIDEAGMIGSRQLERVLTAADKAGAKVVLVGDPEQLQAIEAGAAFRALAERHGAAEITQVRRQREDWQKEATRDLATGRTRAALERYEAEGMVEGHRTRDEARTALVDGWAAERKAEPKVTQVILAHTRVDVAELNALARERMRQSGALSEEATFQTERGERAFAEGDRVMFLRNDRGMGVKNGTLGTVTGLDAEGLTVRLDDGREVDFDTKAYSHIDHGYASTVHKAQGVTVDRAHVLATPGLDRHAAYVALSRHRDGVALHWGADDFADRAALDRTLSRERAKDTTLDYAAEGAGGYARAFAERRDIHVPAEMQRAARGPERAPEAEADEAEPTRRKGRFDGLRLRAEKAQAAPETVPAPPEREPAAPAMGRQEVDGRAAIVGYARAYADAERMAAGPVPHQAAELERTGRALTATLGSDKAADIREAFRLAPHLAEAIETPNGMGEAIKAAVYEGRVRQDPELRADRFVRLYTRLREHHGQLSGPGEREQQRAYERALEGRLEAIKADPAMEAVLQGRRRALEGGRAAEREIGRAVGRERERGMDRER